MDREPGCTFCGTRVVHVELTVYATRVGLCYMCAADVATGIGREKRAVRTADCRYTFAGDLVIPRVDLPPPRPKRPINGGTYIV